MKSFKHLLFLSILCSLVLFTNCGDSDDVVAVEEKFTLTVLISPTEGGSVSYQSGPFTEGTKVTLTATANDNYTFKEWTGAFKGTVNPMELIMNANNSVTAVFELLDTDGDGVTDATELANGTDLNDPCSYLITSITSPIISGADCDEDGITDDVEITNGTDPFDPCDPNNVGELCFTGIYLPTGFSPNGDGQNDVYEIKVGIDVASFVFHVYDRWGNRVLRTMEKELMWDGTFNGEICNTGVYAFMLEVVYTDGSGELRSGNITLIR